MSMLMDTSNKKIVSITKELKKIEGINPGECRSAFRTGVAGCFTDMAEYSLCVAKITLTKLACLSSQYEAAATKYTELIAKANTKKNDAKIAGKKLIDSAKTEIAKLEAAIAAKGI